MKPLAYVVAMLAPGFAVADSAPILNFDHAAPVTGTVFDRGDIWRPLATNGYSFFVRETVWATHLAVYDDYQDGLVSDYDVGLWGADGLVASATVEEGASSPLAGSWRTVDIGRVQLEAGSRYVVGAVNSENARWRDQRDGCEGIAGGQWCEFLGVPNEMPFPEVDQYYWLLEPYGGLPPNFNDISATVEVDVFQAEYGGVSPLISSATGLHAPNDGLLVSGLFAGATVFIEVPEPSSVALLGVFALTVAAGVYYRRRY
jgi:hypothetical protein